MVDGNRRRADQNGQRQIQSLGVPSAPRRDQALPTPEQDAQFGMLLLEDSSIMNGIGTDLNATLSFLPPDAATASPPPYPALIEDEIDGSFAVQQELETWPSRRAPSMKSLDF